MGHPGAFAGERRGKVVGRLQPPLAQPLIFSSHNPGLGLLRRLLRQHESASRSREDERNYADKLA